MLVRAPIFQMSRPSEQMAQYQPVQYRAATPSERAAEVEAGGLQPPPVAERISGARLMAPKAARAAEEDTEEINLSSAEQKCVERDAPAAEDSTAAVGDEIGARDEISARVCDTRYRSVLRTDGEEQVCA